MKSLFTVEIRKCRKRLVEKKNTVEQVNCRAATGSHVELGDNNKILR